MKSSHKSSGGGVMLSGWPDGPGWFALEWAGSALEMSGTFLLASRCLWVPWTFPVWAPSNAQLAVLTWRSGRVGILTLELAFLAINAYACVSWVRGKAKA